MGWVGGQLAVCAGMRYLLVSPFGPLPGSGTAARSGGRGGGEQWRELFSVPEELAYSPAMLATMPDLGRALLVVVSRRPPLLLLLLLSCCCCGAGRSCRLLLSCCLW